MESFSSLNDFKDTVAQYYCNSNSEYEITYIPRLTSWLRNPYFNFVLRVRFERTKKVFEYPTSCPAGHFESLIKDLDSYIRKSYRMNFAKKWLRD